MNLLNGVCPVKGVGEGVCTHPLSFSGDGSSQAGAKVAAGTKGKSADFKSPDLGCSAHTLIKYNHR